MEIKIKKSPKGRKTYYQLINGEVERISFAKVKELSLNDEINFVDEFTIKKVGFIVTIHTFHPSGFYVESVDLKNFDNLNDALKYNAEIKASGTFHSFTVFDNSINDVIFTRRTDGTEYYYDKNGNDISHEDFIKIYVGTIEPVRKINSFAKASYANTLADIIINLDPKYRNWGIQKIKNAANLKGFDDVRDAAQRVLDEGFDSFTVGDYINLTA